MGTGKANCVSMSEVENLASPALMSLDASSITRTDGTGIEHFQMHFNVIKDCEHRPIVNGS